MEKSIFILKGLLAACLVLACMGAASAQRGYGRDYTRGPRIYSRNAENFSGRYQNYTRRFDNHNYRSPVIIGRRYPSVAFGPRYYSIPRGSISVTFGGNPYFYFGGNFYQPFGSYYRPVMPPIGIRIGILPAGYIPVFAGPNPYYFYNGTYYRRYDDRSYEVVDAPMGAQISTLPTGARSVRVNGEKFFELNGTYYKEDRDSKGRVVYSVVGKNGEIKNTEENQPFEQAPKVGDKVSELPANTKLVTLNGDRFYVTPNDTYYRAEIDGSYTIVGMANENT